MAWREKRDALSERARTSSGSCAMRRMPNDTIIVSVGDLQVVTASGDPGLPTDAHGGNDVMIATVRAGHGVLTLLGDDADLQGRSRGGNDLLVADVEGEGTYTYIDGDAQTMSGHSRGGNDTIYVDASHTRYSSLSVLGDAGNTMSGDARGGNDDIIAVMGSRASGSFGGDTGYVMSDNAHGGNDILNVTQAGIYGGASMSGDALYAMSGNTFGGNDILIYTVGVEARSGGASLEGDTHYMSDNARGGDDILIATVDGNPDSTSIALTGDASNMSGNTHGGNDILLGGERGDWLYGDARIYAPTAPGSITGGRDLLDGGGGNDQLWGGPNNDLFVFGTGSGQDVINDFNQGNMAVGSTVREHDVIDLHAYGFAGWTDLKSLISDDGAGHAVIQLTANDTITLDGVRAADLKASDFIV
ncbi:MULTISPECIES: hypothetical protein [Bradyrhizobium]|uniref:hypothetical protein n=1 Tax=Bradyrhizobium TaxID=374 RepID=UPI00293E8770|nr:hypothetical protein [Bradyrhizobium sp. NDS-1]WOH75024.1 hypothetical protein RX330_07840 [Bradyrhizobium sp. NDS-1]